MAEIIVMTLLAAQRGFSAAALIGLVNGLNIVPTQRTNQGLAMRSAFPCS